MRCACQFFDLVFVYAFYLFAIFAILHDARAKACAKARLQSSPVRAGAKI
jgi:hypothetical protein